MQRADIIIIGGGPGGYETAAGAVAKGKSVILFEKDKLGGTCLNRGCIPTKCLCAAADALDSIKKATVFGVTCENVTADYSIARNRANEVVAELTQGIEALLAEVTVVNAEAFMLPGNRVEANGEIYEADKLIIATGSKPEKLNIPGNEFTVNSDEFLNIDKLPERLAIIGGGVIGLEFASVANSFGTEVTVIEYCKEILPGCDADVAKRLRTYLTRRGIEIITDARVLAVDSNRTLTYERKGKQMSVESDMVLAAVGRRPVLPLCKDGMELPLTEKGYVATDNDFKVSGDIYAIGDVNGKCMLAHAASAQGRVVLGEKVNTDVIPSVVFTRPECAFVSDKTAQASRSVKLPYSSNGKAVASGEGDGIIKVEFDDVTRRIVACAVVGVHAADLIAEASLAISSGMTIDEILTSVHAHPTMAELFYSAVERASKS